MLDAMKNLPRFISRRVVIVFVPVLLLAFLGAAVLKTQAPVTYASLALGLNTPQQTNFQVVNKSTTQTANILIQYYDSNGNVVSAATAADTIGPGESKIYYQYTNPNLPSGFRGSAVVSADQPIEVIAAEVVYPSSPFYMNANYRGATQGGTTFYMPLVFSAYSLDWNTRIAVQNVDPSNMANVSIKYYNEAGTNFYTTNVSIPPNASRLYDHRDMGSQLGSPFMGSAVISSNVPVAVVLDEYSNYWGKFMSYNAVPATDASTKVFTPLIAKKYSDNWYTNIFIRNVGSAPANVTVTYKGQGLSSPLSVQYNNIVSHKMVYQILEAALPDGFFGSATVQSSQPIVTRVQWTQKDKYPSGGYNGFPSGSESTTLVFPCLYKRFSAGWHSAIYLMNTSSTTANVTITYYGGGLANPVSRSYSVPQSLAIYQAAESGLPDNWFGAARITSSQPIVAVAENNPVPGVYTGDALRMYEAFKP